MNRGSTSTYREGLGESSAFNEAPIHESGKSDVHANGVDQRSAFNEAPIHESGK